MTSITSASSAVSVRYAGALIDLAQDKKLLNKVEKDMHDLSVMMADSADLLSMMTSPLVSRASQLNAIMALAKKAGFQTMTSNFLGVLAQNGRLNALQGIMGAFQSDVAKRRGEVTVGVQVAQDMSAKQKKDLQSAISKSVGTAVKLDVKVEPGILGGMIVTVGSHMIDDSVARKLERLKAQMSTQSNENIVNMKKEKA